MCTILLTLPHKPKAHKIGNGYQYNKLVIETPSKTYLNEPFYHYLSHTQYVNFTVTM